MTRSSPDEIAGGAERGPEERVGPARPFDNRPSDAEVVEFLRAHHGAEPTHLKPLSGGFWSAAYGYRLGDEELVLRINDEPDGFRADDSAHRRRSSGRAHVPSR